VTQAVRFSIVVPIFNSQHVIHRCLDALVNQTVPRQRYEILVVDDGSTEPIPQALETNPDITLIRIPHGGPSAARNAGVAAAWGDIVAFTDSDCVPAPDWLEKITQPFGSKRVVGVKGVYCTQQKELIARFVQLEYQYKYDRMAKLPQVDFIDTYSAAYRRDIFLQNGGFDTSFTVPSVEDQEFSFRLAQKGYHLEFIPEAAVYHVHDRNLSDYWKRKFGIGYWKAYMLRWLPQKTFNDSHTSPSQRWQIGFLGLALIALALSLFMPDLLWLASVATGVFFLSGLRFLYFVLRRDLVAGLWTPLILVARAAALGAGLAVGFIMPPRRPQHQHHALQMGTFFIKRIVDLIGSLIGLVLSAPMMLIAAVAIRLDSPGPAFFSQERAGENGKPFRIYKLRTMCAGAEGRVAEVLVLNPLEGPSFKIPNDPRVTRVGRFLRRWSIDETPQFWNVLKGEMSLVGPRPEELWVVEKYNDEQRKRLAFKPGLTGPMQINGRGSLNFDERLKLELDYMQNYSLAKDLDILVHSITAVITGKGAY